MSIKFRSKTNLPEDIAALQKNSDVLGMILIGSHAENKPQTDEWSDFDLVLIVKDESLSNFYPSSGWLEYYGEP
ncbi:aminoglycoside 6-adenylyltransferase [Acidobacteriota bacterium]